MGDWLLTVPLLLIELILVMKLPAEETKSLSVNLGVASAVMVALGYPGEIQDDLAMRWIWWAAAMVPFCLYAGRHDVRDLVVVFEFVAEQRKLSSPDLETPAQLLPGLRRRNFTLKVRPDIFSSHLVFMP